MPGAPGPDTPVRGREPKPPLVATAPPRTGSLSVDEFKAWGTKYRQNLLGFIQDTWNAVPDRWQADLARKFQTGQHRRMAIASGHGVGKTCFDAWVAIWFLLTRFPCKIPITAPSQGTLQDGLFAEIKLWIGKMPRALRDLVEVTSDRVVLKAAPERAFLTVRTARADKPDALQGIHADYVLMIVDEPTGVADAIFESAQGSLAGPARYMLMTGNPVYASGYFYESITTNKDTTWDVTTVSCYDAQRVPPEYIEEMAALYGEESNVFRVRVLGLPPKGDDDTIIPLHLIQAAFERDIAPSAAAPIEWGLDVARLGANQAALVRRQGPRLLGPPTRYTNSDLMQLTGRVAAEYQGLPPDSQPAAIYVDAIGMGAGVVDRLRELGLPVIGINVSESQALNPTHFNLKSELWWRARAWFAGLMCQMDPEDNLVKALSVVRIDHHSTGKLLVESKDKLARRLKSRLPAMDAADAFVLTFAGTAATAMLGRAKRKLLRGGPLKRNLGGIV